MKIEMEIVLMEEEWRDVVGYEGLYQVSNLGRIKSFQYGNSHNIKIMNKHFVRGGYVSAQLWKSGTSKCIGIHRLVAQAFLENPNNFEQVNHKDENPSNNCVDNLEWCSVSYNINYGNRNKKVAQHFSKEVIQFSLNGKEVNRYESASATKKFGFITSSVIRCCNGKLKQHHGYVWRYASSFK